MVDFKDPKWKVVHLDYPFSRRWFNKNKRRNKMSKCKREFGVDLDTLIFISKAKSIWIIERETDDPYWRYLEFTNVYVNLSEKCIFYSDEGDFEYLKRPLSEFGKTWSTSPYDFESDEFHGVGAKTDKEWQNEKK